MPARSTTLGDMQGRPVDGSLGAVTAKFLTGRVRLVLTAVVGILVAGAITAPIISAEVRFLLRAAYEEARILLKRESLETLLADPSTTPERRGLFGLVLEARSFASQSLGLDAADTYTTYTDVGRDTLVLVISASSRTALVPYVWRYPIVGRVPYKGYFDPGAALNQAARLEDRGYDTYVRPAGAFSTLGWFRDPLLSTILGTDSVGLVGTVLHEIAHNTLYVPSATSFNESFASFVGYRGAEVFFQDLGDSASAWRAATVWHDELLLADFYDDLASELEVLYAAGSNRELVLRERERIFWQATVQLTGALGDRFKAYRPEHLARRSLNNASVIAARLYRSKLDRFDAVFAKLDRDLRRTIAVIVATVQDHPGVDPFQLLEELEFE